MKEKVMNLWSESKLWHKLIAISLIVGVAMSPLLMSQDETQDVLYSELDDRDLNDITQELSGAGIDNEVDYETNTITVSEEVLPRSRALLSSQGLPNFDHGYDVLDNLGIGATKFDREVGYVRAKEGELQSGLSRGFNFISSADVQLHISMDDNWFDEQDDSTASVAIKTVDGDQINEEQVEAIQSFVGNSIEDLMPEGVVVMDEEGRVYDGSHSNENEGNGDYSNQRSIIMETEQVIREDIMNTLDTNFGKGNSTLNVRVDIDFDEIVRNIEEYDPDHVLVSSHEKNELTRSAEGNENVEVGQDENEDVLEYGTEDELIGEEYEQQKEEIIENFEVGKTVETVKENPELVDVQVATTINNRNIDVAEEDAQEFIEEWEEIIAAAAGIGVDEDGELSGNVVVSLQNFYEEAIEEEEGVQEEEEDRDQEWPLSYIVGAGLGIALVLLAIAKLITRKKKKKKKESDNPFEDGSVGAANSVNPENEKNRAIAKSNQDFEENFEDQVEKEMEEARKEPVDEERAKKIQEAEKKIKVKEEVRKRVDEDIERTVEYFRENIKKG